MKPMMKPPGTKRLQLKYDSLLSNFAFNFNLRRYTEDGSITMTVRGQYRPEKNVLNSVPPGAVDGYVQLSFVHATSGAFTTAATAGAAPFISSDAAVGGVGKPYDGTSPTQHTNISSRS